MLVSLFECLQSDCSLMKELILSRCPNSDETGKCVEILRTENIFQVNFKTEFASKAQSSHNCLYNVTLLDILFGRILVGVKIKVHNVFYTHTSIYSELILSTDGSKYR